jgi:hypothetical protein
VRDQAGHGPPALDRQRGHACLHDGLTRLAAQLRAELADYLEAGRDVFEHLALVLAPRKRLSKSGTTAGRDDLRTGSGRPAKRWRLVKKRLMSDCQEQSYLDSDVSDLVISLSHAFPKPSVKGIPLIFLMPDHFGFYAREPKWELIDRKRIHFLVTFREA